MDRRFRPDANPYLRLLELIKKGQPAALATIIETRGSTPQVEGASALFSAEGLVAGTIGGGIVEAEVQKNALLAVRKKKSKVETFNLSHDPSEAEGAICGGSLRILIDASPERNADAFRTLKENLRKRTPGVLATLIERNRQTKRLEIRRFWSNEPVGPAAPRNGLFRGFQEEFQNAGFEKEPRVVRRKSRILYLEPHFPQPRLVIAGAGHIGQAVAHLGALLDFEVTVIDDRGEYANRDRFPEAAVLMVGDIGTALKRFPVALDTYVVIATRGHARDEEALRACINRPAGYIGMIGSRRKVDLMKEKFLRRGWATSAEFDRIRAPIGLDIRSKSVQEIAVSIAAELVLSRSRNRA